MGCPDDSFVLSWGTIAVAILRAGIPSVWMQDASTRATSVRVALPDREAAAGRLDPKLDVMRRGVDPADA